MDRQESVTKRHISLSVHHPSAHTRLFYAIGMKKILRAF